MSVRVAVVGAGHVGATFAYALLLSGLASEIVLVDVDRGRLEGEVMDLVHTTPFSPAARVWAGELGDCAGAAVTVIAAGPGQRPGQTRLDLARVNAGIVDALVPEVVRCNPDGVVIVATNPVDVLTRRAILRSGLDPTRVLGSGTVLDTARFRALIGRHCGIDPRNVHAYILGEHGDSEVPAWSTATVAGLPLRLFCEAAGMPCDRAAMDAVFAETRDAAAAIIRRKGATWYAIGAALVRIVEAIVRDQKTVLTVSTPVDARFGAPGVCMSLPAVVGAGGVERVLPIALDPDEEAALRRSAGILQAAWGALS
ncbi:MAG: L-lactate dehydrogenase [Myxococcota bacterium]